MFDFLKKNKTKTTDDTSKATVIATDVKPSVEDKDDKKDTPGFFKKLKLGLTKTRQTLTANLATLFLGKKNLDQNLLDEIETVLISADVGVDTTQQLIDTLTQKLARKELNDSDAALLCLKQEMKAILQKSNKPFLLRPSKPHVVLVVGINGSGKTTTIGKLAHYFQHEKKNILLAAGDTFRAAAIEQLQIWGERNNVPVIAQQPGADTAAVIYDALEAAQARHADVLIADTAGRLHTQTNLMAELKKVKRVLTKLDPEAPHDVLIVLDASLGQNALNQVKQFNDALGVTGIVLTKLDGTAKGGIIFAIAHQTKLPIYFIGVGEGINDLRPFDAEGFINALFS